MAIGHHHLRGAESETVLTRSFLTGLSQAAAHRNNEYRASENGHDRLRARC